MSFRMSSERRTEEWVRGFWGSGVRAGRLRAERPFGFAQGDAALRLRLLRSESWRHVRATQRRPWRPWRFARGRFFASLRGWRQNAPRAAIRRELEPFGTERESETPSRERRCCMVVVQVTRRSEASATDLPASLTQASYRLECVTLNEGITRMSPSNPRVNAPKDKEEDD